MTIKRAYRLKGCSPETAQRIVDLLVSDAGISSQLETRANDGVALTHRAKRLESVKRSAYAWLSASLGT